MPAKVSAFIICDDIRKEMSNKEILIGVYGSKILVPSYPVSLRLATWIEFEALEKGNSHWNLRIEMPSGNAPVEIEFDMQVLEAGAATFAMGGLPFHFERDGEIIVTMRADSSEWSIVKKKLVSRATAPTRG